MTISRLLGFFIMVFLYSCDSDLRIGENNEGPFVGEYEGLFNCVGRLERENGDNFEIEILRVNETDYILEIEDEYFLTAFIEEAALIIPVQVIEELFDLDDVQIDGIITALDDENLNFDFYIDSDDGEANCVTILFED